MLASCGQRIVFDEYVTIPSDGWNIDSMAVFKVDLEDNALPYDVYLNVRNRSDYPNSNIWLFVDIISPSGKIMQQKVDCQLADDNGRWLGSGWGDLYLVEIPFYRGVKFAEEGEYQIRIVQGMYDENIAGIHNVGIRIEEAEIKNN